jgi:hypothetical protein
MYELSDIERLYIKQPRRLAFLDASDEIHGNNQAATHEGYVDDLLPLLRYTTVHHKSIHNGTPGPSPPLSAHIS